MRDHTPDLARWGVMTQLNPLSRVQHWTSHPVLLIVVVDDVWGPKALEVPFREE